MTAAAAPSEPNRHPFVDAIFAALAGPNRASLRLTPRGRSSLTATLRRALCAKAEASGHLEATLAVIGHLAASGAVGAAREVADVLQSASGPTGVSDRTYRRKVADALGLDRSARSAPTVARPARRAGPSPDAAAPGAPIVLTLRTRR